ncbi:MAG TPA: response regulator transcription factor [Hyphomicrobiaceae bacterium]|nr:response regulator transcription factor [Hyphomicrobiaceae bacterium]
MFEPAQEALRIANYDLLISDFDTAMASDNLLALIKSTRSTRPDVAILACGSRAVLENIVGALGAGAHDFVLRPFDGDELRIRISTMLARRPVREAVVLECGPLSLDMVSRQVLLDGNTVDLTPRERSVLQVLMRHRGHVVAKEDIASRVFSMDEDVAPQAIETYVHRLRRKTEHPRITIKTLRGVGYLLDEV